MKFYIDTDECKKLGIPINVALYLASIYYGKSINRETISDSCKRGFMIHDGYTLQRELINPSLTQSGVDIVETIFLNSEFRIPEVKEDRFDILADKLRELYPKGKKPGTSYMWKDSTAIISKKLKTLVKKFDFNFTDEQAINATKAYIESFNGDYRYMQLLKYFILKRDEVKQEEASQLMSYIQNEGQEDINNSTWSVDLK